MSVLIADSRRGLFLGCEKTGVVSPIPCPAICPFLPLPCRGGFIVGCRCQREVYRLARCGARDAQAMPAPPGMLSMCVSPCGRYLYQLGGECDSVHMRSLERGELLRSCPAGVYPRDMRLDPTGRYLLISGGAAGELMLLDAIELRPLCAAELGGAVCAADFVRGGAMALVTRENGELQTSLVAVPNAFDRFETLALFEGQAGALRAATPYCVALGVYDGVKRFDIPARALTTLTRALPLPAAICCRGSRLLVSDTLSGQVAYLSLAPPFPAEIIYQGGEAQANYV